jgi:hypothetical protein
VTLIAGSRTHITTTLERAVGEHGTGDLPELGRRAGRAIVGVLVRSAGVR